MICGPRPQSTLAFVTFPRNLAFVNEFRRLKSSTCALLEAYSVGSRVSPKATVPHAPQTTAATAFLRPRSSTLLLIIALQIHSTQVAIVPEKPIRQCHWHVTMQASCSGEVPSCCEVLLMACRCGHKCTAA